MREYGETDLGQYEDEYDAEVRPPAEGQETAPALDMTTDDISTGPVGHYPAQMPRPLPPPLPMPRTVSPMIELLRKPNVMKGGY